MLTFGTALKQKIKESKRNNFGIENFDEQRFGKFKQGLTEDIKHEVRKIIYYKLNQNVKAEIFKYQDKLEYIWNKLKRQDQDLLVDIIAYRLLGYKKVRLPLNNDSYLDAIKKVKLLKKKDDTINSNFTHFILERFNLKPIGYDVELYFYAEGIVIDFIIEQYAYKADNDYVLHAEKGDVVLDIGACWGDTALYFADKVGEGGKVFSFEFMPDNIKIFNLNMTLNPHFNNTIELIDHPVSDKSGQTVYYKDNGPGSKIYNSSFESQTGSSTTISVDDFVEKYNILKVDFIKMDIEGAEPAALRGALNTIKKHKPKLAIAIYHGMGDFVNIPIWLMDLNLGYDYYLGHHSIHAEETVIYAHPKNAR